MQVVANLLLYCLVYYSFCSFHRIFLTGGYQDTKISIVAVYLVYQQVFHQLMHWPRWLKDGIIIENCPSAVFPFLGLTIWPFVFLRDKGFTPKGNPTQTLQHERIHLAQQIECFVIPFYLLYFAELFIRIFTNGFSSAYSNISFEREAYWNEKKKSYLGHRPMFAFTKYYNPKRLTYGESFEASRAKLKDGRKRNMQNQKEKYESMTAEEQTKARSERHRSEDAMRARMQQLVDTYDSAQDHPNISVCIDLSFDGAHSDRERRSLCKQLCFSYNTIRGMPEDPLRLYLTGLRAHGNVNGPLEESLLKQGVGHWGVKLVPESAWNIPDRCLAERQGADGDGLEVGTQDQEDQSQGQGQSHGSSSSCFHNIIEGRTLVHNTLLHDKKNYIFLSPDAPDVITSFRSDKVAGLFDAFVFYELVFMVLFCSILLSTAGIL